MATRAAPRRAKEFDYDVSLSFAGGNRAYVRKVADALRDRGVRVFFDEYEQAALWGRDLYTHLNDVYENAARFCVLFASKQYAKKVWTNHERQSAQARAIREHSEYILPSRFDDTVIPGLRQTVHYIDLRRTTPLQLAELVQSKIGTRQISNYFPPVPDRLFKRLGVVTTEAKNEVTATAHSFFFHLSRMTPEERHVLTSVFRFGCPTELPKNVHINVDYLRRITGMSPSRCVHILAATRSLGIEPKVRKARRGDSEGDVVVVEWHDLRGERQGPDRNATDIANDVILGAVEDYCDACGNDNLARLDFSQLARSTSGAEKHRTAEAERRLTPHAADSAVSRGHHD
jgi:hypothetical protein